MYRIFHRKQTSLTYLKETVSSWPEETLKMHIYLLQVKAKSCFEGFYKAKLVEIQEESSKQLQKDITDVATKNFFDLSTIELVPSTMNNPKILEYDQNNDRIHAVSLLL